jgi:GntR family negative regulator for fad regulon and positive regulator of fabA
VSSLMRINNIESGKMWQKLRDDLPAEMGHDNT